MASGIYNGLKLKLLQGGIDLENDDIRVALMGPAHTFDPSSAVNDKWSQVSTNETTGSGYTSGGKSLTGQTVAVDDTGDRAVFDAADLVWAGSTIRASAAVLYDNTATDPADMLICSFDFGETKYSAAGEFTLEWHADGIIEGS